MNRIQFSKWLFENYTALAATVPVVFTPDQLGIKNEDEQRPFLDGVQFGLGFAAKLAASGKTGADYQIIAENAQLALRAVEVRDA